MHGTQIGCFRHITTDSQYRDDSNFPPPTIKIILLFPFSKVPANQLYLAIVPQKHFPKFVYERQQRADDIRVDELPGEI